MGLTLPDSGGDRGTKEAQARRTLSYPPLWRIDLPCMIAWNLCVMCCGTYNCQCISFWRLHIMQSQRGGGGGEEVGTHTHTHTQTYT